MHHAVAAVHAGWRHGVGISEAVLQAMADGYGTRPQDVEAAIGPGISLEAFEVGDEVYEAPHGRFPDGEDMRRYPATGGGVAGWKNGTLICRQATGLAGGLRCALWHGFILPRCTYLHSERFFYATLGIRSGRILNGIFSDGLLKYGYMVKRIYFVSRQLLTFVFFLRAAARTRVDFAWNGACFISRLPDCLISAPVYFYRDLRPIWNATVGVFLVEDGVRITPDFRREPCRWYIMSPEVKHEAGAAIKRSRY